MSSGELEAQKQATTNNKKIEYVADCQVETDMMLQFNTNYIENVAERIRLYQKLDAITEDNDLQKY